MDTRGDVATKVAPNLDSSVSLMHNPSKGRYYILAKSSVRRHVQIIKVDPATGSLKFTQTYGRDMFPTEAQAFEFLKHEGPLEVVGSGKHCLGYVVIGHTGLLLLVEKVRLAATLPGNHQVKSVVTSRWHKIPLQSPQLIAMAQGQTPIDPESILSQQQRDEYNRGVDKVTTFPVDGAHYFCETIDATRPFPSFRPTTQPSWEFVWNRWLTVSFRNVGLDFLCPALMQGLCEERGLLDFDGAPYSVALISRRGRLHVGPRYKARGLNDYAEPANEIEVEQVIWRKPAREGQPINWSRYTWRRGSVPLWWGVHMKNNGLGEAEIKIREQRTFKGSRRYVRRLQKRYCPVPVLDPDDSPGSMTAITSPDQAGSTPRSTVVSSCGSIASSLAAAAAHDPSLAVPLVFVSLLRKGTPDRDRSEAKLAAAFDFMCNAIKKEHKIPLQYIALDWHELDKQLGSHELVAAFWETMKDILPQHRFALGTLSKVGQDHYDLAKSGVEPPPNEPSGLPSERCLSNAGLGWQARWFRQQRGVARYNCADSLDRTNVGSFFGAVQVLVEQCRELDIAVAVGPRGMGSIVNAIKRQQVAATVGGGGAPGTGTHSRTSAAPRNLSTISQRGLAGPSVTASGNTTLANGMQGLSDKLGRLFTDFSSKSPKTSIVSTEQCSASYSDLSTISAPHNGFQQPRCSTPVAGHPNSIHSSSTHQLNGSGGIQSRLMAIGQSHSPQPHAGSHLCPRPASPGFNAPGALDEIARSLPPGWEVKLDNASDKVFYVDHNTRTTHWHHPTLSKEAVEELGRHGSNAHLAQVAGGTWMGGNASPPLGTMTPGARAAYGRAVECGDLVATASEKLRLAEEERELCEPLSPWCMLKSSTAAFARRINPEALSALAELFLVNGDMSAWLYTGSQAMHSERILLFEPENSKLRKAGVGAYGNIMVGIKRRYNNVMMDTERQQQIELFLGMKHMVYFPTTKLYYKEDPTVPLDSLETDDDSDPVGHIDWAPTDRSIHSGTAYTPDAAAQTHAGGHNRHRNKSYSSVDLLWDKQPGSRGNPPRALLMPPAMAV